MNTTGLNQFFKYGDIEDEYMKIWRRSIDHIQENPYHINECDLDSYINGDGGGDSLIEICKHKKHDGFYEYYFKDLSKYHPFKK